MTVAQTVLVYGGIPLAIILLLTIGVYGRSTLHQPNRYRPGRPWNFPPAWFLPHPGALPNHEPARLAIEGSISGSSSTTAVGGASGEW